MLHSAVLSTFLYIGLAVAQDASSTPDAPTVAQARKPNVVFILTDDQDLQMNSMNYMQSVKTLLTDQGMYFKHHYATVALCCPSRVSMWTGKAAHNTNVTDLAPPYGGYPKFIEEGYHEKWLPVWLQKAGYKTYYTGKLFNAHSVNNYQEKLHDLSLDGHDFMIEPGTYQYLNTTFQHNFDPPKSYPGDYATDLLSDRAVGWIDEAANGNFPFFLAINPVNPHSNVNYTKDGKHHGTPPIPAPRHAHQFLDATVPETANLNPKTPSGASWIKELDPLSDSQIRDNNEYYVRRLQALQAVDDLVNATIARLEHHGMLDNTLIIYSSDNGFHIGQHRLTPGKRCPYEEDINVPLVIRGPGIPKGQTFDLVTSHLDLVPSILEWTGANGPGGLDGVAIPMKGVQANDPKQAWEHVQVEHWGRAKDDEFIKNNMTVNTYKAMRIVAPDYSLFYSVWCGGDHEVYDMKILGVSMNKLITRLDALLLVLKTCSGKTCYLPWSALHPKGGVTTLTDALNPQYDAFYAGQPKVKFDKCAKGYEISNEMPIHYDVFGQHSDMAARNAEAWRNWEMFTD